MTRWRCASQDDDAEAERWEREIVNPGRLAGESDPAARLVEMEREGAVAEVLIPDFRLPFVLNSAFVPGGTGGKQAPGAPVAQGARAANPEENRVAARAYNRWVADFCGYSPQRFRATALVPFADVDAALDEIRQVKAAGLRGIMMPMFDGQTPLYDPKFEPIWSELEELDLLVNCHIAISGIFAPQMPSPDRLPNLTAGSPLVSAQLFFNVQQCLFHLIWGGVLQRHPRLRVVMTETGSGWIPGALEAMDYKHGRSYLRQDIRDVVPLRPSEYFARQCFIGSSIFTSDEMHARHRIGVDKMMIGIDYPHHEGTWTNGTQDYLQATMGAAGVTPDEADTMLGKTTASVYGFDYDHLARLAQTVGPTADQILTGPAEEKFPRGDAHKPLSGIV